MHRGVQLQQQQCQQQQPLSLGPPGAADRPVRRRGLKTGLRRCSRRGPASPPMRGTTFGWSSTRPITEVRDQKMPQAAEMTPATPATTSATARPAGPHQGEGVRERPRCSGLWKPRPRAAPQLPPAAARTTRATPTGHKACDAVAGCSSGGLDDHQDRRRQLWMPGVRPKWP